MKPFVAALRRLIAAASDKDDKVSNLAVRIIGFIGPDARAATPELIQNLQDTKRDPRVRQNIITGLSAIASHDSQTGQALINAAYDGDRRVRCAAVAALGRGGFAYKDAEPLLKVLLNDPDRVVAQLAYESLCQIEPENVRGVPVPTNPQISGAQMVVSSVFSTAYFMASMVSGTSDAQLLLMYSTNSTRRASGQLIH